MSRIISVFLDKRPFDDVSHSWLGRKSPPGGLFSVRFISTPILWAVQKMDTSLVLWLTGDEFCFRFGANGGRVNMDSVLAH